MNKLKEKLEQLKHCVEEIITSIEEPERPSRLYKGQRVLVSDGDKKPCMEAYLSHINDEGRYVTRSGQAWDNCIPNPNFEHWVKWSGGPCPDEVKGQMTVIIRRDGVILAKNNGKSFDWGYSNNPYCIVEYMVIKRPEWIG